MRSSPFSFAAPPAAAFTLMKTRIGISLASLGPGAAVPCPSADRGIVIWSCSSGLRGLLFLIDLCATVSALGVYPHRVGVLSLCLFFQLLTFNSPLDLNMKTKKPNAEQENKLAK